MADWLSVHQFLPHSRVNGPGNRAVLWVQGCPGCFNPQTHPWEGGEMVTVAELPEEPAVQTELTEPATLLEPVPQRVDPVEPEWVEIVTAFKRRVCYLLTLKGRPPFRLTGLGMYERLSEVTTCLDELLAHSADPKLKQLQQGLRACKQVE